MIKVNCEICGKIIIKHSYSDFYVCSDCEENIYLDEETLEYQHKKY